MVLKQTTAQGWETKLQAKFVAPYLMKELSQPHILPDINAGTGLLSQGYLLLATL